MCCSTGHRESTFERDLRGSEEEGRELMRASPTNSSVKEEEETEGRSGRRPNGRYGEGAAEKRRWAQRPRAN